MFSAHLLVAALYLARGGGCDRLQEALDGLELGLRFMEEKVTHINLDGFVGTRLLEEQLSVYLEFEPRVMHSIRGSLTVLRDLARRITDAGALSVQRNDPVYYTALGRVLDRSQKPIWYRSRSTDPSVVEPPVPCALSYFNKTQSDLCIEQVVGSGTWQSCTVSASCVAMMTASRQQGYYLTHQMLYWQLIEMRECRTEISESSQVSFCSRVMSEAQRIATAQFPRNQRDLFLEQIALCGIWGFMDTYRPEWLDTVLSWQDFSGCFNDPAKWHCTDVLEPDTPVRVKRRERVLENRCLSHKTTLALLAITTNIRFEAERVFNEEIGMY